MSAPAIAALLLGAGFGRADARPDPGFGPQPAEQTEPRFFHDLELGVLFVDTELIQGGVLGFFDRATGCLNPLHRDLPALAPTAIVHAVGASAAGPALGRGAVAASRGRSPVARGFDGAVATGAASGGFGPSVGFGRRLGRRGGGCPRGRRGRRVGRGGRLWCGRNRHRWRGRRYGRGRLGGRGTSRSRCGRRRCRSR